LRNIEEKLFGNKKAEEASVVSSGLLSFVAPTHYVDLPSQGRFYPVGHPLHGKNLP